MQDEVITGAFAIRKRYSVGKCTLYRWIKHQGFPAFRINSEGPWRVRHAAAMEWFALHEKPQKHQKPA